MIDLQKIMEAQKLDEATSNSDYFDGVNLNHCPCGGLPLLDISMTLINCPRCGLSFEYRYNRGVIPYHIWQLLHQEDK